VKDFWKQIKVYYELVKW